MKLQQHAVVLTAFTLFALMLVGCEKSPEPQKIGVFASTNRGLLELTVFGEQTGMTSYSMRQLSNLPTAKKIVSFYVNMPDSKITNSKVYWLAKLDQDFNERGQAALNLSIENAKTAGTYRIACTDLEGKNNGYVLLKVGMPLGTPDRMYAIHLAD